VDGLSVSFRARQLVEPLLVERGFELVDVEHKGNLVRITVDRAGGLALDLDALSDATRLVSDEIDRHDVLPERCILEVSSPGIERPLRTPEHFQRAIGSTVAVKRRPGGEGDRRLEGVLVAADDEGIVVADRRIPYTDVDRARTVFVWGNA
jgi:ribosome maturation factor RimP